MWCRTAQRVACGDGSGEGVGLETARMEGFAATTELHRGCRASPEAGHPQTGTTNTALRLSLLPQARGWPRHLPEVAREQDGVLPKALHGTLQVWLQLRVAYSPTLREARRLARRQDAGKHHRHPSRPP